MHTTHRNRFALAHRSNCARRWRARGGLFVRLALAVIALACAARAASAQEKMFVLPDATEGANYEAQITTSGSAPFTWAVVNGEFPSPLTLTNDGKLKGISPAARVRPFQFQVRVIDSSNPPRGTTQWLSLTVRQVTVDRTLIASPGAARERAVPVPSSFILPTSTSDEETIALTQIYPATPAPTPTFDSDTANAVILQRMIGDTIGTSTDNFKVGDYCAIHLVMWKPLVENKSDPDREIWALFQAEAKDDHDVAWSPVADKKNKDVFDTRIYGRRRVAVLLIHLNTPQSWDVKYKVSVNQKIPTPLQDVLTLAASLAGGGPGARNIAPTTKDVWGARMMLIKYESSEIVVKLNTVTAGPDGRPVEQSKEHTSTFVDEGRYHWDVSVGLPVQSVRELQFKSDGGRVFAESKEKQSVYGFFNFYPKAVDLKSDKALTPPHFVFGVPLASKPLQRPFAGVGIGVFKTPIKFNIFGGIVFIRERVPRTLGEGSTATTGQLDADLHTRWVRKGMFGINVPVSQIKDAIKGKSK